MTFSHIGHKDFHFGTHGVLRTFCFASVFHAIPNCRNKTLCVFAVFCNSFINFAQNFRFYA